MIGAERSRSAFGDRLLGLLEPPDELMLEAGAVGEVLVARIRLVVVLLVCLMPLAAWVTGGPREEVVTGAFVAVVALTFSIVLLRRVRNQRTNVRWRFVSSGFDVTAVSLVLTLFLLQGLPHVAVNSRVVWELYLISIAATALRGDARVCLFAGGLALVQYGVILIAANSFGDLNDPRWAPFQYGYLSWGDQISRLILIAAMTLLALACVHQTRKLLSLSSRDRLTGIRNRAWLDSRLNRELAEIAIESRPLTLAMVDVDLFKPFNDQHGHVAGDAALRAIAQRLAARIDSPGFVARYGGEEFTVVFPGVTQGEACRVLDRVRVAFERDSIQLPGTGDGVDSPTLSIGAAALNSGESGEALIERADRALIQAKRNGRNRLVAAE